MEKLESAIEKLDSLIEERLQLLNDMNSHYFKILKSIRVLEKKLQGPPPLKAVAELLLIPSLRKNHHEKVNRNGVVMSNQHQLPCHWTIFLTKRGE